MLETLLILAGLVPLALAPVCAAWADRSEAGRSATDGFVGVALGGIVLLHVWPHAWAEVGIAALAGGLAGVGLPFLLHGGLHRHEERIYPGFVAVAFLGLAFHAALDGAVLFGPLADDPEHTVSAVLLALAVVLHRFPMALAVWWLVAEILGRRLAVALLGLMGAATLLGFSVAGRWLVGLSSPVIAVFQAAVAGMLLHVVFGHEHHHAQHPGKRRGRTAALLGVAAGWTLLVALHLWSVEPLLLTAGPSLAILAVLGLLALARQGLLRRPGRERAAVG